MARLKGKFQQNSIQIAEIQKKIKYEKRNQRMPFGLNFTPSLNLSADGPQSGRIQEIL